MNAKINAAAVDFLNQLRFRAAKDGIRATKAVEMMVEKFPTLSRSEAYHTAEAAGINRLTARNVYDRLHPPGDSVPTVVIKDRRNHG